MNFFRALCAVGLYAAVVCLRLTDTSRCSTEMAKHKIAQTTPYNSPRTLSEAENFGESRMGVCLL